MDKNAIAQMSRKNSESIFINGYKIDFVCYDHIFLSMSYQWLTDPETKRLTMTPDITREGQEKWFAGLFERTDYYIRGILSNGKPIGAVGIKNICGKTGEYWGYIGEKEYRGHGIGHALVDQMCQDAIYMGLTSLYLHVADFNLRAYKLYEQHGFIPEEIMNGIVYMRKNLSPKIDD